MSIRYPPEHRAAVLEQLKANHNNVAITSARTGIPERTIRDWRRKDWLARHAGLPPQAPLAAAAEPLEFEDDVQALKFVREQIIREIVAMAASLRDTLDTTAPYHRVLALAQLLDRLGKLDGYIPNIARDQVIHIEYRYPDGSVHLAPPWVDDADDAEGWDPRWDADRDS